MNLITLPGFDPNLKPNFVLVDSQSVPENSQTLKTQKEIAKLARQLQSEDKFGEAAKTAASLSDRANRVQEYKRIASQTKDFLASDRFVEFAGKKVPDIFSKTLEAKDLKGALEYADFQIFDSKEKDTAYTMLAGKHALTGDMFMTELMIGQIKDKDLKKQTFDKCQTAFPVKGPGEGFEKLTPR